MTTDHFGSLGADPVAKASPSYDQVYRRLRRAVLTRQIEPGIRLVETELARQLAVSRTPVREALRRLESDGFVERGMGGGLYARPVDIREIEDIFLIRQAFDQVVAVLAAQRGSADDWAGLRDRHAVMAVAIAKHGISSAQFHEAHFAFHRAIYDIAFTPRLAGGIANHILVQLEIAAELSYADPTLPLPAVGQHQELLDALASGDPDTALSATLDHTRRSAADAKAAKQRPRRATKGKMDAAEPATGKPNRSAGSKSRL